MSDGEPWEKLATALDGGMDEFVRVAQPGPPERWREVAREASRQRMERHEDLPRSPRRWRDPGSIAWKGLDALSELDVPVLVVGSQDDATGSTRSEWPRSTAASSRTASWWWRTRAIHRLPGRGRAVEHDRGLLRAGGVLPPNSGSAAARGAGRFPCG